VRSVVPDKFMGGVSKRAFLDDFPTKSFVYLSGESGVFR
jgi:hypothetical protein